MYGSCQAGWFYPVALGMAVVAVAGGIANSAAIAYPAVLWGLMGGGWVLAALHMPRCYMSKTDIPWLLVISLVSLVALVFLTARLMPSTGLNFQDDFQTYLQRPVRMLQTGTLDGGWFDLLGLDSLGGQAFFQGLLLLYLPINYINGFDAVFCTALAVALAGELAWRLRVHILYGVTAMAALVLINPQTVNVSTLYAGAIAIQGLILSILFSNQTKEEGATDFNWGTAVAIGLFLALTVVLKSTLALFVILFTAIWFVSALLLYRDRANVLSLLLRVVTVATLAVIPWLVLNGYKLLTAVGMLAVDRAFVSSDSLMPVGVKGLLPGRELFYGGSTTDYGVLVMVLILAGIAAMIRLWLHRNKGGDAYLILVFASSAAAVVTYLVNPYLTDPDTAIRYSIPVLIAVVPFVIAALGRYFRKAPEVSTYHSSLWIPEVGVGVAVLLTMTLAFGDGLKNRIHRIDEKGTLIAFPVSERYLEYCRYAFDESAKISVRRIQNATEPGTGVLPWISQPFHLDFSRNRVLAATEPALLAPWVELPLTGDANELRKYLVGRGVRYIIWEKSGFGVKAKQEYQMMLNSSDLLHRRLAKKALKFLEKLNILSWYYPVIFKQNLFVVIDLDVKNDRSPDAGTTNQKSGAQPSLL
jgi:hypothetical protein